MRARFEHIDHGYRCKPSYRGYGYIIECESDMDNVPRYDVYHAEDLRIDDDNYIDTYGVGAVKSFDTLKEAREFCFTNAREAC